MHAGRGLWVPAYVGVGSNMGDPAARVRAAFEALRVLPETTLVATSRLYRTAPFGPVQQGDFINAAAGLLTRLEPDELLLQLRAIETTAGRVREQRWGPRTLDLDLLVFGDARIDTPELTVPHPGIRERVFVLAPLHDLAPTLDIPGMGRVADLRREVDEGGLLEVLAA